MICVSGSAGFIGFHVAKALLERGEEIVGIDNLNDYYDPCLKKSRIKILKQYKGFSFYKKDICDYSALNKIFNKHDIHKICHLAAQAGVRYSLEKPFTYQRSNNEGFLNMLELARYRKIENFVFASSSSVYGNNKKVPFSESDRVDNPISLYAATKKANELAAHVYNHLFGIPCSGLRFFTVYGPWGRPDMALFKFTEAMLSEKTIEVFNHGKMLRNFTYVDDIVKGTLLVLDNPVPYEIYNIGNDRAEQLMDFIAELEKALGVVAQKKMLPMQPGDVTQTIADIDKLKKLGYDPKTNIAEGIQHFVAWYKEYYGYSS